MKRTKKKKKKRLEEDERRRMQRHSKSKYSKEMEEGESTSFLADRQMRQLRKKDERK